MKKYRIEIPGMIPKELGHLAWFLDKCVSNEICDDWNDVDYEFSDIPKSWLTEIIEEPKTFDEWFDKNLPGIDRKGCFYFSLRDLYNWTIKNERLKHKPKFSLDRWLEKTPTYYTIPEEEPSIKHARKEGWKACLESHNLEE